MVTLTYPIYRMLISMLVFLTLIPSLAPAQQGSAIATVISIQGRLDYRESADSDWKPANMHDSLYEGYQLRTEAGNRAMFVYNTTIARVLINENTRIEIHSVIDTLRPRESRNHTKLIRGEIYSKITFGSFEVETPSSVARVTTDMSEFGTEFRSAYDFKTGAAAFLVFRNAVSVSNERGSLLLEKYQTVDMKVNQQPGTPKTLSVQDARRFVRWLENF